MKVMWKSDRAVRAVVALCALLLSVNALSAATWQIDTVDQSGTADFTSLKIDTYGNIHVAYIPDVDGHPLKYAFWDHVTKRWFTMTVTKVASFCTLTLDSKQRPHISFADHGTGLGAKLRHAYWDGKAWQIEPIEIQAGAVVAYYTSIALDKNDNPFFSFYDYADPGNNFRLRMRSVSWEGDHWAARTVDAQGGSGKFNVIAVDSAGRPHIAYANVKYESSGLRYASWTGSAWQTEIVEGANGPCPLMSVGMLLDSKDNPHITYTLTEARQVKYATRINGVWHTEAVAPIGHEAYPDRNGIALDKDGNPYISYYDMKAGTLTLVYRSGGHWMTETLDNNFSGFTSSLGIFDNTVWISYADETGKSLKVAHRQLQSPAPVPGTMAAKQSSK